MKIQVVKDRKSEFGIYLYPGSGKVGEFARKELRKYVERMTGVTLPDAPLPGHKTIILGLREHMTGVPACMEGYDGYTIVASGQEITICGENGRGLLYGVYDLLEQWGCRFFMPQLDPRDCEVVPQADDLAVEYQSRSEASPMEFRINNVGSFFFKFVRERVEAQIDWLAKNRYNGISWQPGHEPGMLESEIRKLADWGAIEMMEARGMFLHGPGHSFYHFLPAEKYFDEHPEYFGMKNGQRTSFILVNFCWSNKEAVEICQNNIISFVREWPIFKILYLVANDGGAVCECPDCSAIGGPNLLIQFFNTLSEKMEKELPGVLLEGVVGYGPMEDVPLEILPNGKWGALHAHWGCDHTKAYGDTDYSNVTDLYVWTQLFPGKLEICSYYTNNSHQPYIGVPYLYALEKDMDFMVENNIRGSFILNYPFGTWWPMTFNNIMGGRIAYYHKRLKPIDALRDFCYRYFGEKAGETMFMLRKVMSDNLSRFGSVTWGNGNEWDMKWLHHLQKMNYLAKLQNGGEQPYEYRIEKNIMLFKHQIMWGNGMSRRKRCEQAVERYRLGEISREEALDIIVKEKQAVDEIDRFTHELEQSHPGLMEADWFRSWVLNRLFYDPVQKLEEKLS